MKIFKNFLSDDFCDHIINFHTHWFNQDLSNIEKKYHRGTEVLSFELLMLRDKILRQVYCKLIKTIKNVNDKLFISHTEIVKWPTNTAQGAHFDFSFAPCTTILYLNDNFDGVENFLEKKIITPKKGNLIFLRVRL